MNEHLEWKVNGKIHPQLKKWMTRYYRRHGLYCVGEYLLHSLASYTTYVIRCIASSIAHLEEISEENELISNIGA